MNLLPKLICLDLLSFDDIKDYTTFLLAIQYCIEFSKKKTLVALLYNFVEYKQELVNNKDNIICNKFTLENFLIDHALIISHETIAYILIDLFNSDRDISNYPFIQRETSDETSDDISDDISDATTLVTTEIEI